MSLPISEIGELTVMAIAPYASALVAGLSDGATKSAGTDVYKTAKALYQQLWRKSDADPTIKAAIAQLAATPEAISAQQTLKAMLMSLLESDPAFAQSLSDIIGTKGDEIRQEISIGRDVSGENIQIGEGNIVNRNINVPEIDSLGSQVNQQISSSPGQTLGSVSGGQAIHISGGKVFFQDGQGKSLDPNTLNQPREIPSLLPYLPDRTDQEFELSQAILALQQNVPRQPLVFVVHGDEWQSHYAFLERLRKVSLPRLLRLNPRKTAIKEYHLKWPASLNTLEKLPARLTKNLADEVGENSYATVQDINQTFGTYPGPVLVHLHLLTDDWKRLGTGLLPKVLEYWQTWPNLGPEQPLIIGIFIKYQQYQLQTAPKKRRRPWLFNPFAWLKRFLKCRQCQKLNVDIAQQLAALSCSDFKHWNRLTGIVLPKLDNINRGHVEDWVRCKELETFAGEALVGQLLRAVGKMFDHDETMPMDSIGTRLTALLKEIVIDGRER